MAAFFMAKKRAEGRKKEIPPVRLIVISFVLLIVAGTALLSLPISQKSGGVSLLDSLFTATSATCVTGLSIGDTYCTWSLFGQGVILFLIQVGGLGLATFAIGFSLLIRRKMGIREMLIFSETSGGKLPELSFLLRLVLGFTLLCEMIGAGLLMLRFVPLYGERGVWPAVFIAVSAYCNAGFDILGFIPGNSSLSAFAGDPLVSLTVSFLIIIGGLGFVVVANIYESKLKARFRRLERTKLNFHSQICLRISLGLLLFGTLGFFILEYGNTMKDLSFFEKLNAAFFQSANTRTAGFASVDIGAQGDMTKLLSAFLMFIGGCPGSTAGGIKVTTFVVLFVTLRSTIRGEREPVTLKHRFSEEQVYKSFTAAVLGLLLVLLNVWVITALNPQVSLLNSLYEAVSAFGTVGLSAGITSTLEPVSKLCLILTMLIGRVGPISFGLSIMMRKKPKGDSILPEGRMLIG